MKKVIASAMEYAKKFFERDFSGHDYYHSMRVYNIARIIAEQENANIDIVSLAAILHDVDDRKLSPDTYITKANAVKFLQKENVSDTMISRICSIIQEVSFQGNDSITPTTIEGKCVQDADRLDALGAIGIARTFAYGGNHNRAIYHPEISPMIGMTAVNCQTHISTSIDHFYEKLFLLKDMMNTECARNIAEKRERYMKEYIEEFMLEWNGNDLN